MAFLTPYQKQTILWVGIGVAFFVLLLLLGPILTPFVAGAILAYALNPVVSWLRGIRFGQFHLSRTFATVIVMILLIAIVVAIGLVIIPTLLSEWPLLYEQVPQLVSDLSEALVPYFRKLGLELPTDTASFHQFITEHFFSQQEGTWKSLIESAKFGGTTVLNWAWNIILIPFVLFYLLKDWPKLVHRLRELVPRRWLRKTLVIANDVHVMLAQYLRGQLSVMVILAIYYSTVLSILGYHVALPVGIISGMLAFVPYIGITVGLTLAIIATILQFSGFQAWVTLAIVYGFGHSFDAFFMTPNLVGSRIQLHPLMVIFALLAFGHLFGFVGVLVALPSSAILSVAFKHLRKEYEESHFYRE